MGHCFMSIEKVKSMGAMSSKYKHNYREVHVDNADPLLKDLNEELVRLPQMQDGRQMDYTDFFKDRIKDLPYYEDHKIRSNAVYGLEVLTTFSREDDIDIESWKKRNVEWLEKTFNVAPDGRSNIASVIYHADEAGNVHCHAMVIPIDERGHLNSQRFINGSRALSELQTSYAKDMSPLGLERGLKGSQATHKDIKKYYAELNQALRLPEIRPGESAAEYLNRFQESLQTLSAASKRQRDLEYRKHVERISKEYNSHKERMDGEYERQRTEVSNHFTKERQTLKRLEKQIEFIESKRDTLNTQVAQVSEELQGLNEDLDKKKDIDKKVSFAEAFQKRYEMLSRMHPERAELLNGLMRQMQTLQEQTKDIELPFDEKKR